MEFMPVHNKAGLGGAKALSESLAPLWAQQRQKWGLSCADLAFVAPKWPSLYGCQFPREDLRCASNDCDLLTLTWAVTYFGLPGWAVEKDAMRNGPYTITYLLCLVRASNATRGDKRSFKRPLTGMGMDSCGMPARVPRARR